MSDTELICTVCNEPFDIEVVGGVAGDFGILPMAFCPECYAGIVDMVFERYDIKYDEDHMDDHHLGPNGVCDACGRPPPERHGGLAR